MDAESMSRKMPWRRELGNDFPCAKDCPDRHMACHTGCEKYMKAKEKFEAKKAEMNSKRNAERKVNDYISDRVHRLTKKTNETR